MSKTLFLLRGLPGSGKSTLSKLLGGVHIEADQYFMENGEYKFDSSKIKLAHNYCQSQTSAWMNSNGDQVNVDRIVVSNTFTQEWEMKPYFDLAKTYGYQVFSIIVENRHEGENVHGCPKETIEKMRERFEILL
jgi:predicted kinase